MTNGNHRSLDGLKRWKVTTHNTNSVYVKKVNLQEAAQGLAVMSGLPRDAMNYARVVGTLAPSRHLDPAD